MMGDLERRLAEIERQVEKGGRVPAVRMPQPGDLEKTVRRVFAARPGHELERALADLHAARSLAAETWARVQRAGAGPPGAGEAATKYARAGGAAGTAPMGLGTQAGGLQVLFDWVRRLPHTYRTKTGKHCVTDRWISDGFLVYDPALEPPARGSIDNPWFGISGPKFRCYYPASSMADWESCMSSGSSGRWINAWSQKSLYIKF